MVNIYKSVPISRSAQPQEVLHSYHFEFGQERRTPEEVKQWYRSLKDEQLPTEFLSVAYMKDQNTSFEHEFLLIYLSPIDKDRPEDYSFVCRVERSGNGSRSGALLNGDYCHDTIRIFSKDNYTKFEKAYPHRVLRVLSIEFKQRLDLLRILELCYSLQESDTSARYTLLQFNCYFMCWMILINLVRGIDKWDDRLDTSAWGGIVTKDIPNSINTWVRQDFSIAPSFPTTLAGLSSADQWQEMKRSTLPNIDSIAQYLCFRALDVVLGRESGRVVETIIDSIQTQLESARDELLLAIDNHNSTNLFTSNIQLHKAVMAGLSSRLSTAANKALQQDTCTGQSLWSLLSDGNPLQGGLVDSFSPEFEAKIAKKLHKMWFGYMRDYLSDDEFWSKVQREAPNRRPRQSNGYVEHVPLIPQVRIWKVSYKHAVVEILGSCPKRYSAFYQFLDTAQTNMIESGQRQEERGEPQLPELQALRGF